MEDAQWLFSIEDHFHRKFQRRPSAVETSLALLLQLDLLRSEIEVLSRHCVGHNESISTIVRDQTLHACLDGQPDPELTSVLVNSAAARGQQVDHAAAADQIVKVSILIRVLDTVSQELKIRLEPLVPCSGNTVRELEIRATRNDRMIQTLLRRGIEAELRYVTANQRLVWSIVTEHGHGMSHSDLAQEGNLGLLRAIEKFDYRQGYRFSTYASWWIRQAIGRASANQGRTIRLPVHVVNKVKEVEKISQRLAWLLGRNPTLDEIAEEINMDAARVREIMDASQDTISLESSQPLEEDLATATGSSHAWLIEEYLPGPNLAGYDGFTASEASYQGLAGDDGQRTPDMPDIGDAAIDKEASHLLLQDAIWAVLHSLSARERQVLELRFGLHDGRSRTLEEVGKVFDVTRERIRQIEAKALRKLRHPTRATRLRDYIE